MGNPFKVIRETGQCLVVEAYANPEIDTSCNGEEHIYPGNVYLSEEEMKMNHPGEKALVGYALVDQETGEPPVASADWYETPEDALSDIENL